MPDPEISGRRNAPAARRGMRGQCEIHGESVRDRSDLYGGGNKGMAVGRTIDGHARTRSSSNPAVFYIMKHISFNKTVHEKTS
jgi:hypothetical protein